MYHRRIWSDAIGLPLKQKNVKYPLIVIFKLWNYQTKVNLLKAQMGEEINIHGQSIQIIQDLSAKLRKCKQLIPIRQSLEEKGIFSTPIPGSGYGRLQREWSAQVQMKA